MADVFNTREIATLCWLGVALAWMLSKAPFRKLLWGVVRAFFRRQILSAVCVMALYSTGAVVLLAAVGMWGIALRKDTIVWFCASAMAMAMRLITWEASEDVLWKVIAENFRVVILLEFLVNTYTFSLPAELVLMPSITLIVMLNEYASAHKQDAQVANFTQGLQALIGFAILAIAVIRAVSDLTTLGSVDTLRRVALAPLLSLLFIPCLYALVLASKYQQVFLRLDIGPKKDPAVKRYARRRILAHVGLSMRKIHLLLRNHAADLTRIQTEDDVDRILTQMRDALLR